MSWLFALGRLLKRAGTWLLDHPLAAILLLFAIFAGAHQFVIDPRLRNAIEDAKEERDAARAERDAEVAAHQQTKRDYRAAQLEAARLEQARLARVEAEQQEITDEVVETYEARLGDARARAGNLAEQLRRQARAGERAPGAGGGKFLSGTGAPAGRADQAAGDRGLPSFGRSPAEQLERDLVATEQALQLDALIEWVLRQAALDPNATAGAH